MAKSDTYGYKAGLERRKAKVRIKAYERIIAEEKMPEKQREYYKTSLRELRAAQAATRTKTKSGRAIEGRTTENLDAALETLRSFNEKGEKYIGTNARSNAATQRQLNIASVDGASVYTKAEVKIFYRATQDAWQRPGVDIHTRNEAILEYYGRSNLAALVDEVLGKNQIQIKAEEISAEDEMTAEQREMYEREPDESDKVISPSTVGAQTENYLEELRSMVESPERM